MSRDRTLVIQTSFLGDMVLTTPLIAHLAEAGDVDVVGTPAAVALLANHPAVRRAIAYDKRGADRGIAGFWKLATQLRGERYDRVLLAQGSARSGALAVMAGIRQRTGFDSSAGRPFYTTRVPYIENEHHAQRLFRLSGESPPPVLRPTLYPGAPERDAVDAMLAGAAGRMVALAPGSVWSTKRWPGYAPLARSLAQDRTVVVIGANADAALGREVADAAPGRVIDATGKLSLLASAELIARCDVLVTNDSAPQHLASAMNTPTVAIFGPTVPGFGFGPLAARAATVGIDTLACRPCDKHGPMSCPLGHWKCMRDIAVADVVAAISRVSP